MDITFNALERLRHRDGHVQVSLPVPARQPEVQQLQRHGCLPLAHPLGRQVRCESGTLWLTFDGDSRDVILEAGDSLLCDRDSMLLVQALAAATLSFSPG